MKRRTIYVSVILVLVYSLILCCCGVFGTGISGWFMSWVPVVIKILAILAGFLIVVFLPFRIEQALMTRKNRKENLLKAKKLAILEQKQKKEDKIAKIVQEVNKYE